MSDENKKPETPSKENSEKGVKAGWGALWIFIFVIAAYLLLDWLVLTPLIEWFRG